ncbi:YqiA/YcfP family alpha/beta fold hydrolase [Sulfurovum sp.]|uniref:YqiA/YcfP family alpha/beta fold hydrolase n=1 Tax=Sulfurovum sp. TaxID=1969726 RepID=UPI0028682FB5|nr:YqiA/YcfP family alpha/beta fold hydrolase [Sulfurovum sp.]
MSKILYLHGFSSCGEGNKSSTLKRYFGSDTVVSPDLPPSPFDAMATAEDILNSSDFDLIIGSSLGGFYATNLAEKYIKNVILLNPSTQPWETLAPYVGWQKRFCDEEIFEFKSVYLEQLKMLQSSPQKGRYLLLLQSGDEVLDYTKAQSLYNAHRIIVESGGNHRFENIDDYLSMIENFKNK